MKRDQQIIYQTACNLIEMYQACMDDYLYIYDMKNDTYRISSQALERFSIPSTFFDNVIENHKKFVYPEDFELLQNDIRNIIKNKNTFHNLQYRWISSDKEPVWINCKGNIIWENDTPAFMIGCINEIGNQQAADNTSGLLGMINYHSTLTNLKESATGGFVLQLGLDDFREINDKLGSDYGDKILKHTSQCIKKCMYPGQYLFRGTSADFILIDLSGHDIGLAITQYHNIRQTIDAFIEDTHYEAVFTISGGIVPWETIKQLSSKELQKISDFSLSQSKRNGKNQYYIFSQKDYDSFVRRRELTRHIRQSINNNFDGFEIQLQPVYNFKKEAVFAAECLTRFHCKEIGTVMPSEFVPILEETGLIIPVGKWILHSALSIAHDIQTILPDFKIGINISYIQVMKSNIINEIINSVKKYNVSPNTIIIELTESGMLDAGYRVYKLWSKLREHDIQLALDDFGTGCSNLQYLYELRPDIIKIDRSFTQRALKNEYEYRLLSLLSDLVHEVNTKICIEGIEFEHEFVQIQKLSPDSCQGYFFGTSCSVQDFIDKFIIPKTA